MKLASWNVNSVRLRLPQILQFAQDEGPDVLALQEIKCMPEQFPKKEFAKAGYIHQSVVGQKGMHGVAIVSKLPIRETCAPNCCPREEARVQAVEVGGMELHNHYVPAGGDEADPDVNPKFAHKLKFLDRMRKIYGARTDKEAVKLVLVGDLNIAPFESDVWSHKQLLKVVSHTPVEVAALKAVQDSFGFLDVARELIPEPEKIFTWWSYRSKDWTKNNRGRRLDHIWVSQALRDAALSRGREAFAVHTQCRSWERPSDHAPIMLNLA